MSKINFDIIKKDAVVIEDTDLSYIDGKYLRSLRMSLGMSQLLFANYLGVTKKAIEKWEQGANKINPPTIRLLFLIDKNPEILENFRIIKVNGEAVHYKKNNSIIQLKETKQKDNILPKKAMAYTLDYK